MGGQMTSLDRASQGKEEIKSHHGASAPLNSAPPLLVLRRVDEWQPVGPLLMCLSDGVHESLI